MSGKTIHQRIAGSVEARLATVIDQAIGSAIDTAIARAFGGVGDETASPVAKAMASTSGSKATDSDVQDLMDVARRAVRLGNEKKNRGNTRTLNKAERKLARQVMRKVKARFHIVSGPNDVWKANRL